MIQLSVLMSALIGCSVGLAAPGCPPLQATCSVHKEPLEDVLVPVVNACMFGGRVPGYDAAKPDLFPNTVSPQLYGRQHEVTVERHCIQCTYAEATWLLEMFGGELVDIDWFMPEFYEMPPNMRLQRTSLRAAAEPLSRWADQ